MAAVRHLRNAHKSGAEIAKALHAVKAAIHSLKTGKHVSLADQETALREAASKLEGEAKSLVESAERLGHRLKVETKQAEEEEAIRRATEQKLAES